MWLSGKVCVVTGAGRGIGRAITQRLVAAGADVIAGARTATELEEMAAACRDGGQCIPHPANLTNPEQAKALVARSAEEFGRLDVLVNNAGVAPLSALEDMPDRLFMDLVELNINSVYFATKAAWPLLKSSGGTIINISSMAAVDPFPGFAAYGATKAWVNTFTRGLADEGREAGIRVFAVAPGAVETQALRTPFPDFPAEQALQPDDVAGMVEWLLDDRCQYASGQTIYIRK